MNAVGAAEVRCRFSPTYKGPEIVLRAFVVRGCVPGYWTVRVSGVTSRGWMFGLAEVLPTPFACTCTV